jgi:hypothetical protein
LAAAANPDTGTVSTTIGFKGRSGVYKNKLHPHHRARQAQAPHLRFSKVNPLPLILSNLEIIANMYLPTLLASLALAASTASAAPMTGPQGIVHNKCDFPIYVTADDANGQDGTQIITPGHNFYKTQAPGIAIKVTKTVDGLTSGAPVLIFGLSYTPESGVYYSLNHLGPYDFSGDKVRIHNAGSLPVEEIVWNGSPQPPHTAAYLGGPADLTLELCDDFAKGD